jgi:hypothetical protein
VDIPIDLGPCGKHVLEISAPFQEGLQIIIVQKGETVGDQLLLKDHNDQLRFFQNLPAVRLDIVKEDNVSGRGHVGLSIDEIAFTAPNHIGDLKAGMPVKMSRSVVFPVQNPVLYLKRKSSGKIKLGFMDDHVVSGSM